MGFTHGGRLLEDMDDFREEIPQSSDDEVNDKYDMEGQKGRLNEEMVTKMNFGGGDHERDDKRSRKDVFEEIIAKSKAYKMMKSEIKEAGENLRSQLDDEF